MLQVYRADAGELQAMAWYAWIALAAGWPAFCYFRDALAGEALKDETLELLSLIAALPEDAFTAPDLCRRKKASSCTASPW